MDCKSARLLLEFTHPGGAELDGADAAALHQHLADCPDCAAQAHEEQRADEHLARAMRDVSVPAGLSDRLLKRLANERDAYYRRWLLRAVAAAAVIAGLWVGYLTFFSHLPALTVDTINQLAEWNGRLNRDAVIKGFQDNYGIAVSPPDNFKYDLLDTFDLQIPPKADGLILAPHLRFVSIQGDSRAEAHVYILTRRQADLKQTMANIGTLSGRGRYTPYVYYRDSNQDTLYVVLYTTGISFEDRFLKKPGG